MTLTIFHAISEVLGAKSHLSRQGRECLGDRLPLFLRPGHAHSRDGGHGVSGQTWLPREGGKVLQKSRFDPFRPGISQFSCLFHAFFDRSWPSTSGVWTVFAT